MCFSIVLNQGNSSNRERDSNNLKKTDYEAFIAGGHTIETEHGFSLTIKHSRTGAKIHLNKLVSKLRTYENNKKAVKYYNFKVKESGNYTVIVKKSPVISIWGMI